MRSYTFCQGVFCAVCTKKKSSFLLLLSWYYLKYWSDSYLYIARNFLLLFKLLSNFIRPKLFKNMAKQGKILFQYFTHTPICEKWNVPKSSVEHRKLWENRGFVLMHGISRSLAYILNGTVRVKSQPGDALYFTIIITKVVEFS